MAYSFDGVARTITLTAQPVMSVRDVYSRWADWAILSDNLKYLPAFDPVGGQDIDAGAGTSIPIYGFLLNGWRIRPQESNHTLNVGDGVLLVLGGGDPFINPAGAFTVRVNYSQPVQAITVSTGGGSGVPAELTTKVDELHAIHGLDITRPLTVTDSARTAGDIEQSIAGDGETTSTVTRLP
jgi:hypothetical protein